MVVSRSRRRWPPSRNRDTRRTTHAHSAPIVVVMNEPRALPPRPRDRLFAAVTLVLAVLLLPVALARHPGRARELACRWALRMRFPAEDLTGLTDGAMAAFTAARTEALWRHGQLIGLTSGYRDPLVQQRLFDEEVRRSGSPASARMLVLPPAESSHVKGIALDVRPLEGARWLEEHGARYDLYRTYDNEWWHFEHRPDSGGTPPRRRPHPGATPGRRAKPCLWSGPFLHRAPGITGTLNDVPGLAAHRDRRRPDDGRSSVSGLALDGASSQIGSTVASGGCDAVHDHAGRQPGSDLRKEAALCLPRGADAGASTTGTTRRCSRSLGFPGPPRPRSAIRDRLSGFVMGR